MSRHYYAVVYRYGEPVDLICYHSDTFTDEEVRAARDEETADYRYASKSYCIRKITAKKAVPLARRLLGLRKYEYAKGHVRYYEKSPWSYYVFAKRPGLYMA